MVARLVVMVDYFVYFAGLEIWLGFGFYVCVCVDGFGLWLLIVAY